MMSFNNIGIIGSTSWGITLANVLINNVENVHILARNQKEAQNLNKERQIVRNKIYKLHQNISVSDNYEKTISSSEIILLAVPSYSVAKNISKFKEHLSKDKIIVSAVKGFEYNSKKTISQYLLQETNIDKKNIGVLSGPNISSEIYDGLPATTVLGINEEYEENIRIIFNTDTFRAYSSNDIIGIEIGGILKNIFAIGAGIISEYNFGTNAMASYITRSMIEIKKISVLFGGMELTNYGNSGLGDLITTCFNNKSRNNQLGQLLAKGIALSDAKEKINGVIEGVYSTEIIKSILDKENLETPIIDQIYNVLFMNKNPIEGINDLMSRDFTTE